ncbi:MAG: MlaD family protein, partial [Candidatus Eisenbacteria bacterium]|nr:MlaD family protein [Candidatus Eisenbacteria bacterium]
MSERSQQIQVGVLFVLSVALLVFGVLWFKNFRVGGKNQEVIATFPTTSGLVKGDPIEVQGVSSGQVAAIRYEKGRAVVTLSLDEGVKLYRDARMEIENVGIMGQKVVQVDPGETGTPVDPSEVVFEGSFQPGIPQLMTEMQQTLETFRVLGLRMDAMLGTFDEQGAGSFREIVQDTRTISRETAILLTESRPDLQEALENLNLSMRELRRMLAGHGDDIDTLLANAAQASERLDSTLVALRTASDRIATC